MRCGNPLPREASPDPLIGRVLQGKYRVVKLLGEGGMGAVYVGEQTLGERVRKVAIKTLHERLSRDEAIRARFHREVGTLAGLEHPNTVQVFDFGTAEDGQLFLVMEFVQGRSIADILEKEGAFAAPRVQWIVRQIGGSLAEAHRQGIIHRDLKPDNVVLTDRAGVKDFVKVLDFGIAKRSGEADPNERKLTQQGMVLGTPPYMSPEQFTGQQLDARSDVYSLGVMAYEMLTNTLPFHADTAYEWATQHMTAAPRPIESSPNGASLPESMRSAVMKALAKSPDQRFATMEEFVERFSGQAGPTRAEVAQRAATQGAMAMGTNAAMPVPSAFAPSLGAHPEPSAFAPVASGFAPGSAYGPATSPSSPPPRGKTQIGEPGAGAFTPVVPDGYASGGTEAGMAPLAVPPAMGYGPPPGVYAQPGYAMQGPAPQHTPAHEDDGGGSRKGLIVGLIALLGAGLVGLVLYETGAFKPTTEPVPTVDLGTSTPTAAPTPTETTTAPTSTTTTGTTTSPPLTTPTPTLTTPKPTPKPLPTPTTPPPQPVPTPTTPPPQPAPTPTYVPPPQPTPTYVPPPVPTPVPTPQPTYVPPQPTYVPPPVPTPTPTPRPQPQPYPPQPSNGTEPAPCKTLHNGRNLSAAMQRALADACRKAGGVP